MEVKARLKCRAKIQTMALGLGGSPYYGNVGAVVTFPSEESFKKARELYGEGAFELIEKPKGAGKTAPKGGKK